MSARLFTVRPLSKSSRLDPKEVFRVYFSKATLLRNQLDPGDICSLSTPERSLGAAIAWPAEENITDTIVQTSKTFQTLHALKLGDKLAIDCKGNTVEAARTIELSERTESLRDGQSSLDQTQWGHWAWYLEYPLSNFEIITPGLVLDAIELKGQRRSFRVEKVNGATSPRTLYCFSSTSIPKVSIRSNAKLNAANQSVLITQEGIGGLSHQVYQLNSRIRKYTDSANESMFPSYYRRRRGGILLYGPSGVGKSLILSKIAKGGWASVHHIDQTTLDQFKGNRAQAVSKIFAEASKCQPSVVIVDGLENWAGRPDRRSSESQLDVARGFCEEMNRLGDSRILVIAATRSLSELDEDLALLGHFGLKIEIPVPDARSRTEILKVLSYLPPDASAPDLEMLAERTHGYVGKDLNDLVQQAMENAEDDAYLHNPDLFSTTPDGNDYPEPIISPSLANFLASHASIRPTAMSHVFLETPKIQYSDIGGNEDIKRALHQAISWPLTRASAMTYVGITPQKALLLYGPPGCSKTLTAQAIATESHLNFLAVKGAELLSMYVGESERAVREVFRKARAASPSILFFDEIDAIAQSRTSGSGAASSGGLNVLTTLLNELDGIEALKGVFVLAATNCPWALDNALLRPGRFDKLLYVGPPDEDAIAQILKIRMGKMHVDEDVDIHVLAQGLNGYSGADVVNVCQIAGYKALAEQESDTPMVGRRHFEQGMREVQSTITPEMIERFEEFGTRGRDSGRVKARKVTCEPSICEKCGSLRLSD